MILSLFCLPLFFIQGWDSAFVQAKEALFSVISILTLLLGAYFLVTGKYQKFEWKRPNILLVAISLLSLFALVRSLAGDSLGPAIFGTYSRGLGLFSYLALTLSFLYVLFIVDKEDLPKLAFFSYISGLVLALYAVAQRFSIDVFFGNFGKEIFEGRVFSMLGNPGYLANFLVVQLLIGFYLLSDSTKFFRKILILSQIVIFLAIIFTETRTALLALALAIILVILKYRKLVLVKFKKFGIKKSVAGLLVLTAVIATVYLASPSRFSISNIAGRSFDSRLEIWNSSLPAIGKSLLIGHGLNDLYVHSPEFTSTRFYQLEENYNLTIDRLHNETLEVFYGFGLIGLVLYLMIFVLLLQIFFRSGSNYQVALALSAIIYLLQNQLSFPDLSILAWFFCCLALVIRIDLKQAKNKSKALRYSTPRTAFAITATAALILLQGIYYTAPVVVGNTYYSQAKKDLLVNYSIGINEYKQALDAFPYFSDWWYYLMMIDKLSVPRALEAIEMIEGESGTLNAWKGNYYAEMDYQKAADYYQKAIDSNPYNPTWVKAYADFLYKVGDLPNALFLYDKFLDSIPEYWRWQDVKEQSLEKQKSYRIFFKNSPDLVKTLERIDEINKKLGDTNPISAPQ